MRSQAAGEGNLWRAQGRWREVKSSVEKSLRYHCLHIGGLLAAKNLTSQLLTAWGCTHRPVIYSSLTLLQGETEAGKLGAPWLGQMLLRTQGWRPEAALPSSMPLYWDSEGKSLFPMQSGLQVRDQTLERAQKAINFTQSDGYCFVPWDTFFSPPRKITPSKSTFDLVFVRSQNDVRIWTGSMGLYIKNMMQLK